MKVTLYAADAWACGHYRVVWPGLAVHALGDSDMEVELIPAGADTRLTTHQDDDGNIVKLDAPETDCIVIQRPSYKKLVQCIPLLRAKGIAVVVDLDDDLSHIDPANPAFYALHPNRPLSTQPPEVQAKMFEQARIHNMSPDAVYAIAREKVPHHDWRQIKVAAQLATLTTVSTAALADRYGRAGRRRVLDNYVPEAALRVAHIDNPVIGWPGSTHSHPGDLKAMGGSIAQVTREDGASFMIVGNSDGADRELGLGEPVPCSGAIDFDKWPSAVTQIGIGVAPLADTRFNEAKSRLKPLELAMCGVPWVASPRAEYARFAGLGAGLLADKPREWVKALRRLLRDEAFRLEQSEAVRAIAATQTIEAHCWRWAEVWAEAVALERQRVSA